jgi:hypothetical protein
MAEKMEASFSILAMSVASSAVMAMGLAPDPQSGAVHKDKNMARFNIDLLIMLQDKTKNNLTDEEKKFLESIITDLQMKFMQS